jgi:hypothetical protein
MFQPGLLGPTALSQLTQLEDRFGLSPNARQALSWQIPARQEAPPVAEMTSTRRLRIVDPDVQA